LAGFGAVSAVGVAADVGGVSSTDGAGAAATAGGAGGDAAAATTAPVAVAAAAASAARSCLRVNAKRGFLAGFGAPSAAGSASGVGDVSASGAGAGEDGAGAGGAGAAGAAATAAPVAPAVDAASASCSFLRVSANRGFLTWAGGAMSSGPVSPSGGSAYAYGFVTPTVAAGSYQATVGDLQFPGQLTALSFAVAQHGSVIKQSATAATLDITASAGPVWG